MEEKNFSSESENEIENCREIDKLNSEYFRNLLREKITNCLNEERKKVRNLIKYYLKWRWRNLVLLSKM